MFKKAALLFFAFRSLLFGIEDMGSLIRELELARYFDRCINESLPSGFNHLFQTGYFVTPSARMPPCGELGVMGAYSPPYDFYNIRFQPFRYLELTGNYRIYCGVEDPGLSPQGFGDFSKRCFNFKLALMTPEDSMNTLPGIALGVDDVIGARGFTNAYIVGTQVFYDEGLELTLGWGTGRYTGGPSRGFFGGGAFWPFWHCRNRYLKGIALAAEYDPIDYSNPNREPHPDARTTNCRVNYGAKYKYKQILDFSVSRIRGQKWAFAGSLSYNFGNTLGFLPKVKNPPHYGGSKNVQALGVCRSEETFSEELSAAFCDQGLVLRKVFLETLACGKKRLWLTVVNPIYRKQYVVKQRINRIVAALTPQNISEVVVGIEAYGLMVLQYRFEQDLTQAWAEKRLGEAEFCLLTPAENPKTPCRANTASLYKKNLDLWRCRASPRYEAFFGSAKGKFKYDLGLKTDFEGFFPGNVFYEVSLSYTFLSTIKNISDIDQYNPSQLPNVNTDYVNYRKRGHFSTDKAYMQKSFSLCSPLFARAALGYFQVNYAGVAGELLWYPTNSFFALGVEGAVLRKRAYTGLGFQSKLRRLDGFTSTFSPYTTLEQWFFDLYFDFETCQLATKLSLGQFLARDKGARLELTRYFKSGLRVGAWVTFTNASDQMHGRTYFNKGVALELPLDLFLRRTCRRVWNYGMAAWLRDAGAFTTTGKSLYDAIYRERT